jgi:hypothetical protein
VGTGASFGMGQSSFGMSDIEDIWWRLIRKVRNMEGGLLVSWLSTEVLREFMSVVLMH